MEQKNNLQNAARNEKVIKLIKSAVFALIGIVTVSATFFFENTRPTQAAADSFSEFSVLNYDGDNVIGDYGIIRVDKDSSPSIDTKFVEKNSYILEMNSGGLWGNFLISDAKINIVIDKVVIIPEHAQFNLEFSDSHVKLSVFNGDVYVGFLDEGMEISEYTDKYSPVFSNRFLVPRESEVDIALSKIDEQLKKLLYSKLVKEFKFGAISATENQSEWVSQNLKSDQVFVETKKQEFKSKVIKGSVKQDNSTSKSFIFWLEENLTFFPENKKEMIFEHLFNFLDDAIFLISKHELESGKESLTSFKDYLAVISLEMSKSEFFNQKFDGYVERLSLFGPGDDQYEILKNLLEMKFSQKRDVYEVVNKFWLNVYRGMDIGDTSAEKALNDYYEHLNITLNEEEKELSSYEMYLAYQNQLFDNLFLRYGIFYRDGYFAIKYTLEKEMLSLYQVGQMKEELGQAFISRKIDFLKRLKKFFFEGSVEVKEAKEILSRLVSEVDDLMPPDTGNLAVIELFESQLKDIGDFWGYLNSPEYHTSKTYGATHEEKYKSYLAEKDQIWSFIDIQNQILGEDSQFEVTASDVEKELKEIFAAYDDITDIEFGLINDASQRYVDIKAVMGGYPFEAKYDRDQQSLKEVYIYGELLSDKAVKLGSLLNLLQQKFADLAEEYPALNEDYTLETDAQRLARIFIAEKLKEAGFEAEMENIAVVDETEAVYRAKEVILTGYEETVLSFDFTPKGYIATNLYLEINGEPLVMDGEYTLDQLKDIVIAENDFDKEKLAR